MSNLETLDLSLQIRLNTSFIDGHHLKLNIINHRPLLNKFTFNIYSDTDFYNQNNIPSNEYIFNRHFKIFQTNKLFLVLIISQEFDIVNVIFIHINIHLN
jgi:hypothetical protein